MPRDETFAEERVGDEETLYRSVWLKKECFQFDEEGNLRVSSQAFADKKKQPSVYRHHLCDKPPTSDPPRMGPDQAVVFFTAKKIREAAGSIEHKSEKEEPVKYIIDVKPDTSNGQHRAHAIVYASPDFKTNRPFDKLKLRLAQLAEWAIMPDPTFVEQLRSE